MDTGTTSSAPSALGGAADGVAATLAMSGVMLAARRAGWTGQLPPRRITTALLGTARTGGDRTNNVLSTATHLAFGAAAGSLFESGLRRWGRRGAGPAAGAAFGAAVWLVSYAGWVPALDILPPPHRDRPGRQAWMFVAHLVYGAVLGALADRRLARADSNAWIASGI
jgi:hypothetical protein